MVTLCALENFWRNKEELEEDCKTILIKIRRCRPQVLMQTRCVKGPQSNPGCTDRGLRTQPNRVAFQV